MVSILYRDVVLADPSGRRDLPPRWDILVRSGVVVAVEPTGADLGSAQQVLDLDGALVLPGFVDAHAHVTDTGLLLAGVDCSSARSVTEILDAVGELAVRRPGRQILGHGWDELNLVEGRAPTAQELDRAGGGAVVYLSRVDVHSAVVSGALADRARLRDLSGWSPDGRVERDAHHAARHITRFLIPPAERRDLQELALRRAASVGVAQLHEMSAPHIAPDEDLLALLELVSRTPQPLPAVVAYRGELVADEAGARAVLERFATGRPGVSGAGALAGLAGDLMMDGSIGSRTAGLHDDYADAPGHRGHLYADAGQVRDHVVACTRVGVQAGFHVIGDGAVSELVDGLRQAADVLGESALRRARHRLEHVEGIAPDGVQELARLGVFASVQPAFDALWGGTGKMYARRLGGHRALRLNPFADLHAAGVGLAFGSDSPVTPFAPWEGVRAALRHHSCGQRLGLATAVAAHTLGGLRAAGQPAPGGLRPVVGDRCALVAWTSPALRAVGAGAVGDPLVALGEELVGGDPVPVRACLGDGRLAPQ